MNVSSLKTRINDKLNKVREFDEKKLNGLEQKDGERKNEMKFWQERTKF